MRDVALVCATPEDWGPALAELGHLLLLLHSPFAHRDV